MFRKVLVANRGAIALRIMRTLRRMGIGSVAVYSDPDAGAMHVAAGRRVDRHRRCRPPPRATWTPIAILEAAYRTGAEAIHPGYGFLAENAEFAGRCEAAGIAFIGPTPEQIRAFGLKHTARALATKAGLPLLPGTDLLTESRRRRGAPPSASATR